MEALERMQAFSTKTSPSSLRVLCERRLNQTHQTSIPKDSVVYIRYKDHVLFKNTPQPAKNAAERETVGWLTQETGDLLCIQHDRAAESPHYSSGTASGLVLLKKCVLEIRALPLQTVPRRSLSCPDDKATIAEYALQTAKRKTQSK
jgi:hypothetical protein